MKYILPLVLLLSVSIAFGALPKYTGYVNDFAGILSDKQSIENELAAYEKNTTVEIAVVTLDGLPSDQTLFSYGVELFQQWGVGKKGEDNGLLILINKNGTTGNRLRMEVGYGLEGYITDAKAGRILDRALPFYQQGDYQKTVESILADVSAELADYQPGKQPSNGIISNDFLLNFVLPNAPLVIFLFIFLISVALRNRCPYCMKGKLKCEGDFCVCKRCGKKFSRKKRYAPFIVGGFGGGGGGGGGFGGFGGGGSGGGGAGR